MITGQEIHEKSPAESVFEFFAWMYSKAVNDKTVISGKVGDKVYQIGPNVYDVARATEEYLETI